MAMAAPVVENRFVNVENGFLGARIKAFADYNGLKHQTIADRIGVHDSIISLWARDRRPVPTGKIAALAEALETTAPRLLGGELPDPLLKHLAGVQKRPAFLLPERMPPVEPTPIEPPAKTPPLDWQPHVQHPYAPLVPTLPMSGRRPVIKGRLMQSYAGVGRIADL